MFDVILNHLNEGKLLFFWDTRQNLFGDFKPQQLKSMYDQMLAEKNKILKAITNKDKNIIWGVFCKNCLRIIFLGKSNNFLILVTEVEKQALQKDGGCDAAPNGRPAVPVIVTTPNTPLTQDKKQCNIS